MSDDEPDGLEAYRDLVRKADEDIATTYCGWINRCLRAIDPRDITHVVHVVRRGSPDEDLVLRGQTIGEWRVHRDRDRLKITMRCPTQA